MSRAERAPRIRRDRSLTETLLSIVLVLEAFLLFFVSLVAFGLDKLDPDWLALVYGGVFIVVLLLVSGLQRWSAGVWIGAALQLPIIALGFIEPIMFVIAAGFVGMWLYCFIKGRQIDRQKAAIIAATAAPTEGETP